MSLKGSAQEQYPTRDVNHELRSELELMMEERQASMVHAMRDMMAEFTRNNGRSESSRAEGSAAVAGRPREAESIEARETTLREDASRNFGVTGRGGAAVSVEVSLTMVSQTCNGGLQIHTQAVSWGRDMICLYESRPLAFNHTAVPSFRGSQPEFTAVTRDAQYSPKGVGFLSVFVSDPPQYIPVGQLDTEQTRYLSTGGTAAKVCTCMHWRGMSCRRLSRPRVIR